MYYHLADKDLLLKNVTVKKDLDMDLDPTVTLMGIYVIPLRTGFILIPYGQVEEGVGFQPHNPNLKWYQTISTLDPDGILIGNWAGNYPDLDLDEKTLFLKKSLALSNRKLSFLEFGHWENRIG